MAVTTTALLIGGAIASAGAGAMKADAQYKAGRAEKRQAMTEAAMVEEATRQADLEAREQIRRTRIQQRAVASGQRAAFAGAGVVGTTGSPIDILGRTAALQELQIQDQAREASTRYSQGFAKAAQIRVAGRAALKGGKGASTGTLISTGAKAATTIAGGFDAGMFGDRSLV